MPRPTFRERGYSSRWDQERRAFLAANPRCVMCAAEGRTTRATVVDHCVPHRGDARLMWSRSNWQPLCSTCHNSAKQQVERRGYHTRVGADGLPLDRQRHPFFRGEGGEAETPNARHRRREGQHGASAPASADTPREEKTRQPREQGPHGYLPSELVSADADRGSV